MKRYKPAEGAPLLRTAEGEAFPTDGKMIDPASRYYARLIGEGSLEIAPDEKPTPATDKPAVADAPKKDPRK